MRPPKPSGHHRTFRARIYVFDMNSHFGRLKLKQCLNRCEETTDFWSYFYLPIQGFVEKKFRVDTVMSHQNQILRARSSKRNLVLGVL